MDPPLPGTLRFPGHLSEKCPRILARSSNYAGTLVPEGTSILPSGWASAKASSPFGASLLRGLSPHLTVTFWHVGNVPNVSWWPSDNVGDLSHVHTTLPLWR